MTKLPFGGGPFEGEPRIIHPVVVNAAKDPNKALLDEAKLPEGQFTFVQLAISEDGVHDLGDQRLEPPRRPLGQGSRRGLDGVSQHQDGRLLGLRLGAGVPKFLFLNPTQVGNFRALGLMVEEGDQAGAVVLRDHLDHRRRKAVGPAQLDTSLHM